MNAIAIAPTVNDLETAIIEEHVSYLQADLVELVFCYTSDDGFVELAEGLAAFMNVPIEEASNYLLPVVNDALRSLEEAFHDGWS